MKWFLRGLFCLGLIAAALWFGARHQVSSAAMPRVEEGSGAAAHGAAAFVGADFAGLSLGALESHAVPWKLVTAALVLKAVDENPALPSTLETANAELARFGFLPAARVVNLPAGVSDRPGDLPLGMTHGGLSPIAGAPVQVANLGCAACHAGVTYDATGLPRPDQAWIGMPNSSLNLEAYTVAIFEALSAQKEPDNLMDMVQTLYPETGWRERLTLRRIVFPLVRARLTSIEGDRPLPFPNGVPGSTNGVAALKHVFGVPMIGGGAGDAGFVSIPDLGYRHWRTSLLVDGAYAVPDQERQAPTTASDNTPEKRAALAAITTFFTVPSMGVLPEQALDAVPVAEDIFAFLNDAYRPQPFPGDIDLEKAAAGKAIYEAECSACHGTYAIAEGRAALEVFPNWLGDVGTDGLRAEAFSPALAESFQSTPYRDLIATETTGAYAAPPLTGLWASAPYLHNGSVPTIWDLLTQEDRPSAFQVGGHALDFDRMGLRLVGRTFPTDYVPFSDPHLLDTALAGQGNEGHEFGSELSATDKLALIEYLKQL